MVMISSRVFPPLLPITANNIFYLLFMGPHARAAFSRYRDLHLSRVGVKENAAQKQTLGGVTRSAGSDNSSSRTRPHYLSNPKRNRKFEDSPPEGSGFQISVP